MTAPKKITFHCSVCKVIFNDNFNAQWFQNNKDKFALICDGCDEEFYKTHNSDEWEPDDCGNGWILYLKIDSNQ